MSSAPLSRYDFRKSAALDWSNSASDAFANTIASARPSTRPCTSVAATAGVAGELVEQTAQDHRIGKPHRILDHLIGRVEQFLSFGHPVPPCFQRPGSLRTRPPSARAGRSGPAAPGTPAVATLSAQPMSLRRPKVFQNDPISARFQVSRIVGVKDPRWEGVWTCRSGVVRAATDVVRARRPVRPEVAGRALTACRPARTRASDRRLRNGYVVRRRYFEMVGAASRRPQRLGRRPHAAFRAAALERGGRRRLTDGTR